MEYPRLYLQKWDREAQKKRLAGIAANDCHHNQVMIAKMISDSEVLIGTNVDRDDQMERVSARLRPGIKELTKGHKPGDILARVDLDPYERSFLSVSTHILASELNEQALRQAIRAGRVYVSHDWICDPTGFRLEYTPANGKPLPMGAEARFEPPGGTIQARFPIACQARLIRDGHEAARAIGDSVAFPIDRAGVYRVEAWVVLDGEERPWLYSNPVYLR
jgi:hypothetical protein